MTAKAYLTGVGEQIQRVYNPELIEVLVQRFILGNSQEKTAEILGVSLDTIKRKEKQALEIFKKENVQN